jgi:hypothetical protein
VWRRSSRWVARVGLCALVTMTIACGDLVNHDDDRRARPVSVAALYLDGGHPTALFAPCENTRMSGLTVSDGVNELWSVIDGDPPDPVTTIRIFVVPTGWEVERTGAQELSAIAPGREYHLFPDVYAGSASQTADEGMNFNFTLADLTSLRPDEVWAVRAQDAKPGPMTREQFHSASAATCDS